MILDVVLVCTLGGLKEENTGVVMRCYLSNPNITTAGLFRVNVSLILRTATNFSLKILLLT